MTIATIFHQFDLELFDTERSTVEYYRDYFNSFPKNGCDGVKVLVKLAYDSPKHVKGDDERHVGRLLEQKSS